MSRHGLSLRGFELRDPAAVLRNLERINRGSRELPLEVTGEMR